jgi:hypothetical protein
LRLAYLTFLKNDALLLGLDLGCIMIGKGVPLGTGALNQGTLDGVLLPHLAEGDLPLAALVLARVPYVPILASGGIFFKLFNIRAILIGGAWTQLVWFLPRLMRVITVLMHFFLY